MDLNDNFESMSRNNCAEKKRKKMEVFKNVIIACGLFLMAIIYFFSSEELTGKVYIVSFVITDIGILFLFRAWIKATSLIYCDSTE